MGYAYSSWSQSVTINSTVTSGKLIWGFQNNSMISLDGSQGQLPAGDDWVSDDSMTTITQTDQDVGNTTGSFSDYSDGTLPHLLTVNLHNTYPDYYNTVLANVVNVGTIPVYFKQAQLTWQNQAQTINEGEIYLLNVDGTVTPYVGTIPGSALLEFCWDAQSGTYQLPTDPPIAEQFEVRVLDNVQQGANYNFSINMIADQFNHAS
jgi:hypothetical protein